MSANNFIHVFKTPKGSYCVSEKDADTGKELNDVGDYANLEDAVRAANAYEKQQEDNGFEIEYGLKIDTK